MPILFAASPLAAIRSAPVSDGVDLAARDQRAGRRVGDDAVRDTGALQLPGGEARALEERPRLVDEDVRDEAALEALADGAERRADPARGERARRCSA